MRLYVGQNSMQIWGVSGSILGAIQQLHAPSQLRTFPDGSVCIFHYTRHLRSLIDPCCCPSALLVRELFHIGRLVQSFPKTSFGTKSYFLHKVRFAPTPCLAQLNCQWPNQRSQNPYKNQPSVGNRYLSKVFIILAFGLYL